MAIVVLLRGVNVGGHRRFKPKELADKLKAYDVVNIGAAGTFVVRKPGAQTKFREALRKQLPFECDVIACDGREVLRIEKDNPFEREQAGKEVVRFVSTLPPQRGPAPEIPLSLPNDDEWLVRLIAQDGQFVFGEYRRHMKTIGYLGQIDKLFGGRATTRNWSTMMSIARVLKARD